MNSSKESGQKIKETARGDEPGYSHLKFDLQTAGGGRTQRAKVIRRCLAETEPGRKLDTTTNVVRVNDDDSALGDAEWAATQTLQVAPSVVDE
jgi:hypothetical protein